MLLFYSPFHSFVHKVLVTGHECGHWDDLERVPTFPFFDNDGELVSGQYSIVELNPLDKVPTLVTDRGRPVYGSQATCEYLDATSKARRMYPEPGPARWHDAIAERPAVKRGVGVLAGSMKVGDPDEAAFESLFGAKQGAMAPGD